MLRRIGLKKSLFYRQTVVLHLSFVAEAILGGSGNKKPPSENRWRSPMILPPTLQWFSSVNIFIRENPVVNSCYGFGTDANLFSSRNSMALIIDNETLIISFNVLI